MDDSIFSVLEAFPGDETSQTIHWFIAIFMVRALTIYTPTLNIATGTRHAEYTNINHPNYFDIPWVRGKLHAASFFPGRVGCKTDTWQDVLPINTRLVTSELRLTVLKSKLSIPVKILLYNTTKTYKIYKASILSSVYKLQNSW